MPSNVTKVEKAAARKFFTVITTVRNGERYILEMLKSVQEQTFSNFEHIVVDDGSTDNTVSLLERYQEENPKYDLRVFPMENMGRGKALNLAVSKAEASWLAIVDADDLWHPRKLELQHATIINDVIDVLGTKSALFHYSDEVLYDEFDDWETERLTIGDFLRSNKLSHSSTVIRRDICEYDENRKSQFDYELWLRLLENKRVIAKIDKVLIYHRIHDNQSFEGRMKKVYRWRSYKLKASKCLKNGDLISLVYNTLKFGFDMLFPRVLRLKLAARLKR